MLSRQGGYSSCLEAWIGGAAVVLVAQSVGTSGTACH